MPAILDTSESTLSSKGFSAKFSLNRRLSRYPTIGMAWERTGACTSEVTGWEMQWTGHKDRQQTGNVVFLQQNAGSTEVTERWTCANKHSLCLQRPGNHLDKGRQWPHSIQNFWTQSSLLSKCICIMRRMSPCTLKLRMGFCRNLGTHRERNCLSAEL